MVAHGSMVRRGELACRGVVRGDVVTAEPSAGDQLPCGGRPGAVRPRIVVAGGSPVPVGPASSPEVAEVPPSGSGPVLGDPPRALALVRAEAGRTRRADPPLRLTRRGRLVVVFLAMVILAVAMSLARVASDASAGPAAPQAVRTHVVRPGETLWVIARSADPHADTRVTVARLTRLNHLPSATVVAGQLLVLP